MRNNFKKISLALAMILVICSVGGCVNKQSSTKSTETKIKWLMLGPGKQVDQPAVFEKINEKLNEKLPGVSLDITVVPSSEYAEKLRLLINSNQQLDIVWSGWLVNLIKYADDGVFLPLNDLMDKETPKLKQTFPDWMLKKASIKGKLYAIPNMQMVTEARAGIRIPKELSEKFINRAEAEKNFKAATTIRKEQYEILGEFLQKVKNEDKLSKGIDPNFSLVAKGYEIILDFYCVKKDDASYKIVNLFETDEMKDWYEVAADWYKKGYIRKDALSAQNPRQHNGKKDGNIMWVEGSFINSIQAESVRYGFPIDVIEAQDEFYIPSGLMSTATAISSNSVNPQKAMKILELVNTDKEFYNMLCYGIEGTHYNKVDSNTITDVKFSSQATADTPYGLLPWVVGSIFNGYTINTEVRPTPELTWSQYVEKEVNGKAAKSKLLGFVADVSSIKTKITQVTAVKNEYDKMLAYGTLGNYKEKYQEFMGKLDSAGDAEIREELQRQLDEFLKQNGLK